MPAQCKNRLSLAAGELSSIHFLTPKLHNETSVKELREGEFKKEETAFLQELDDDGGK